MNGETHTTSGERERIPPRRMNGEASLEELQHDLDRTRADLNDTLRAIEQRFSPGQILDQVMDYIKGGPKEYAHNLSEQVKRNPLPVALIGIGIAWLMMGPRMGEHEVEYTSEGIAESMHGMGERAAEKKADMRARMGRRIAETKERFAHASENLRHRREMASERRGEMSAQLRERGMQARDSLSDMMHDQPIVMGALAVAVGALLGAGLPVSRRERETMGAASGEMMHRGEEIVHKAKEVGREEAARMGASVKEGAKGETSSPTTH
ncbi:MAG: DUF3618 domain-containing protein [Gammaproteobacteria bacterium]|nr:DUF3618 domain-containing protein [Gammaproteobacteria bacterium]